MWEGELGRGEGDGHKTEWVSLCSLTTDNMGGGSWDPSGQPP